MRKNPPELAGGPRIAVLPQRPSLPCARRGKRETPLLGRKLERAPNVGLELTISCARWRKFKAVPVTCAVVGKGRQRDAMKMPSAAVVKGATAAPGHPSRSALRHAGSNKAAERISRRTAKSVAPDYRASPVEAIVDAAADDHAGKLMVDVHKGGDSQNSRIEAVNV
jgi:hypothetical protein